MEPAKINWKTVESIFIKDDIYEHINAPQWTDFTASDESVDDDAWFCRPDCKHPKTAEDFIRTTTASKLPSSVKVSPSDWKQRDANLKRRGYNQSSTLSDGNKKSVLKFKEDTENQNPNFTTTPSNQNTTKRAVKSSTEKKIQIDNLTTDPKRMDQPKQLKSTLSARNLFGGRDILSQVSEFCNELKRLAARAKGRGNNSIDVKKDTEKEYFTEAVEDLNEQEKERKPLLAVAIDNKKGKEKPLLEVAMDNRSGKEKQRKKRGDNQENTPMPSHFENVKSKRESLLQIRTCPPSPQCFSAAHEPTKTTPLKASMFKLTEKESLQEWQQIKKGMREESRNNKGNDGQQNASTGAGREPRPLDVLWFLKPCTFSS